MKKDFKSLVSTIPPRGQVIDLHDYSQEYTGKIHQPQAPNRTRQAGTATQNPAQPMLPIPESVSDPCFQKRFWESVKKTDDCWEWQKSTCKGGYGRTRVPETRAQFRAHRIAYFLAFGKDPGDKFVMHKCDNPKCCRPDHLSLGTHAENMADMHNKGRHRTGPTVGSQNGNAHLSESDVARIVELFAEGRNNKQIAALVGIGHSLVSRIRTGRSWRQETKRLGYEPKPSKLAPKSGRTAYRPR